MPDRPVAMGEGKSRFDKLSIDLVKETEFNGIGGITPDREVGPAFCDASPERAGICRQHEGYLAVFSDCGSSYSSVTLHL
jgi:hypothetical protein